MIDVTEKEFPDKDRVEKIREKLIQDYTGTVLCEDIRPNPPVRGRFGNTYIPLKADGAPTQQRPFSMHGETKKRTKQNVQRWINREYIKRPTRAGIEWSSCGFPVPKK